MNLFTLLDQAARRFPQHGAVYRGVLPVRTWAALRDRALRLAGGLERRHPPGTRIAIFSENCPEYIEALFACWAAGLAAVPMNAKLHPREAADILQDSGAAAVLASPALAGALAGAPGPSGAEAGIVVIGAADYDRLAGGSPTVPADVAPETLAWLFYTSGTTGRSKGAMLTHRNLMAMAVAHLADVESADEHCSLLHAAPMSHGSGLYILPYLARGARQVIPDSAAFEPAEFLQLCGRHPACSAFLAPTMVRRLRVAAERDGCPPNLRTIVYGGGPMYVEDLKKSIGVLGQIFIQIYGQGEAPMTITSLRREDHHGSADDILGSVCLLYTSDAADE